MPRVLVIDDEDAFRLLLERTLTSAHHQVTAVRDGNEGLLELAKATPDLVITDLYMPNCDGFEFMMTIRKAFPALPIIAVSGDPGGLPVLAVAGRMGAHAILRKPFAVQELFAVVNRALSSPGAEWVPSQEVKAVFSA